MDAISTTAAALGCVAVLAVVARVTTTVARALAARVRARGSAAAARGRALGVRGLLAAVAGTATATASAGALTSTATASPAPVLGNSHQVRAAGPAASGTPTHDTYVVAPGDSLWAIAARHLGPGASNAAIAAEWPRWHRANRAVIGSNPSLLLVGTRLAVPHGRRTGTSASPHHSHPQSDWHRTAITLDPDRR